MVKEQDKAVIILAVLYAAKNPVIWKKRADDLGGCVCFVLVFR